MIAVLATAVADASAAALADRWQAIVLALRRRIKTALHRAGRRETPTCDMQTANGAEAAMALQADPRWRATPAPDGDRRRVRRHATVLLVGHVRHRGAESVCLVHDISPHGMMARFTQLPALGAEVDIAVRGMAPVRASVRWVRGYKAGLQFADQQDVSAVLDRPAGIVPRVPRFAVGLATELCVAGQRQVVELVDVSPGGAKLIADRPLAPGTLVQLALPGEPARVPAAICWFRDGRAGLRFTCPIGMATVDRLISRGEGRR